MLKYSLILIILSILFNFTNANNVTIDSSKIIDDKIAYVTMRVNFNYSLFINKYPSKQNAMLDLENQLSTFFFIDKTRIQVSDVKEGSVIIDYTILPRIKYTDIYTTTIITQYQNGHYTLNHPLNIMWLAGSTATYTYGDAYICNQGDLAPDNYTCVYNYQINNNINKEDTHDGYSRGYEIMVLTLTLFFVGGSLIGLLACVRLCYIKSKLYQSRV